MGVFTDYELGVIGNNSEIVEGLLNKSISFKDFLNGFDNSILSEKVILGLGILEEGFRERLRIKIEVFESITKMMNTINSIIDFEILFEDRPLILTMFRQSYKETFNPISVLKKLEEEFNVNLELCGISRIVGHLISLVKIDIEFHKG